MSEDSIIAIIINTAGSILGKDDLVENDSFFRLGATSLDAVRFVSNLEDEHDVVVDPAWIFTSKDFAQLAEHSAFRNTAALQP